MSTAMNTSKRHQWKSNEYAVIAIIDNQLTDVNWMDITSDM